MASAYDYARKIGTGAAWGIHCQQTDLSNTELMLRQQALTQIPTAGGNAVEVVSDSALDVYQVVTVYGVTADRKRVAQEVVLDGATPVGVDNNIVFFENFTMNMLSAGNVTVQIAPAGAAITVIATTELSTGIAHFFTGRQSATVKYFRASRMDVSLTPITTAFWVELRAYPIIQYNPPSISTAYQALGNIFIPADTAATEAPKAADFIEFPMGGIVVPPDHAIQVWADASGQSTGVEVQVAGQLLG